MTAWVASDRWLAGGAAAIAAGLAASLAPMPLLIAVTFAGLVAVATVRLREATLVAAAIVPIAPIGAYAELGPSLPLATVSRGVIAVVVTAAVVQLLTGQLKLRRWAVWPAYGIWLGAIALSLHASIDPNTTQLRFFSEAFEGLAVAGVVFCVFDKGSYRSVLYALSVSAAINAALAFAILAGYDPLEGLRERANDVVGRGNPLVSTGDVRLGVQRVQGTFQHPSFLAAFLAMVLPVTYALALTSRPDARRWLMAVLVLGLAALTFTATRAAWFAGAAGLAVVFAAAAGRDRGVLRHGWLTAAGIVTVILLAPAAVSGVGRLVEDLFVTQGSQATTTAGYRIFLHEQVLGAVADRPWTGYGYGTFDQIGIGGTQQGLYVTLTSADSNPLRLAAETGVLGVAAFAALLVVAIGSVWRTAARADGEDRLVLIGVIAGLTGFVLINFTISAFSITQVSQVFWMLVGAGCAARFKPGTQRHSRVIEPDRTAILRPWPGTSSSPAGDSRG